MAKYYAVVKRRSDDELQHFKYISKKKVNGKWKYFYDDSELKKYGKNGQEKVTNSDGTTTTTEYEQSNDLFDKETVYETGVGRTVKLDSNHFSFAKDKRVVKSQGKISRASAKAEKWIFDNFLDSKKKEQRKAAVGQTIDKGKNFLQGLIDGSSIKKAQGKSQAKKASLDKGVKTTSNAVNKVVGDFKKAKDNVSDTKLSKGVTRTTDAAKKAVNNYKTAKSASEKANTIIKTTTPAFNKTANKLNEGTTSTTDITKKAVNKFKATESTGNKLKPGNTATTKAAKSAVNKFKEDTQKTANKVYSGTTTTAKVGKEAVDKLKNELLKDVGDRYEYQSMEDLIKRSSTTHGGGGRRDNDRGKRSHGGGGRRR